MTASRCTFVLTAVLALASTAPAAEVRGIVAKVDPDKKVLVLEGRGIGLRGAVLVFELPAGTPVMFGDQAGTLSDLEVGRRVRVQYDVADGRQVAQAIRVLGGPRPAAPTATVPPPVPAAGDGLTGVLRHVGYSDREVVVIGPGPKGADTETTVAVPETARITKNGKEATLDDLKEGDSAAVQVETKDGRPSALSIVVGPGAAPVQSDRPASKVIPRLRLLLKVADQVLQGMENRDR
jgi:Cu/Ag efflux protein CusF